ncbi:MAG: hypothetical protein Kow0031_13430 [Anaerolineae bacterium]
MIRSTVSQVNHFVLQKNNLAVQQASDFTELVDRLVGLPALPPATALLAARARVVKFAPEDLRSPALATSLLMRSAPYSVPVHRFMVWFAATARQRNQSLNAELRLWGIEQNRDIEQLAEEVLAVIDDRPVSEAEVESRLPAGRVTRLSQVSRGGRETTTTNLALALRWLVSRGQVVMDNQSADWRRPHPVFERMSGRYPNYNLAGLPSEADAQKALVRAYLSAFGPASEADISFWTGLGKSETARATGALAGETTLTMVEGLPGMALLLKSQAEALEACKPPSQPVVSVLPADDPYLAAHRASRGRYGADPALLRRIFGSSGTAKASILIDGQVAGLWEMPTEDEPPVVRWQLFTDVPPAVASLIAAEMERVAAFLHPQATAVQA